MHTGKLVFAQLMEHLPPMVFERCVARYGGMTRAVLRMELPEGRPAASPQPHAQAGGTDAPGHRKLPQGQDAPARLGGTDIEADRSQRARVVLPLKSPGGKLPEMHSLMCGKWGSIRVVAGFAGHRSRHPRMSRLSAVRARCRHVTKMPTYGLARAVIQRNPRAAGRRRRSAL